MNYQLIEVVGADLQEMGFFDDFCKLKIKLQVEEKNLDLVNVIDEDQNLVASYLQLNDNELRKDNEYYVFDKYSLKKNAILKAYSLLHAKRVDRKGYNILKRVFKEEPEVLFGQQGLENLQDFNEIMTEKQRAMLDRLGIF